MPSGTRDPRQTARSIAIAVLAAWAWLAVSGTGALAQPARGNARTQAGVAVTFTSLEDWNLKAENLSPRGHNPLYFPLQPGFRYILERPNHPWGHFRLEAVVLDKTEPFDVPGIGRFECAIVQEEEFFNGEHTEQSLNWFCIDTTTHAMYAFGELSWHIDQRGRKVFAGTWRVGEADGGGIAEPGMLMPGTFKAGDRYVLEGHEAEAYGYAENMESGITITVPAGSFKDCVRTREISLTNPSAANDKWWCPRVGIVKDETEGELIASDALGSDMASFGRHHRESGKRTTPPVAKITGLQAQAIALQAVPGKVSSTKIERMGKFNVYAVGILAKKDGVETDVFVDIATGEVVGTDR